MKKIAFVIFRYGEGIYGGTEIHTRMLAERLSPYYEVEVLTTTIHTPFLPERDFPAGVSEQNGIRVRRFSHIQVDWAKSKRLRKTSNYTKRLRHALDRIGLLRPLADLHPIWSHSRDIELQYYTTREEYSPDMQHFIETHQDDYAAIIPICYFFTPTIVAALAAPQKCILIPTAHPEKPLYYGLLTEVFTRVRHIAFNTPAEERLCRRIFGRHLATNSIVGIGIEEADPADWVATKAKYGLPDRYVLYVGRVQPKKINQVVPDFLLYKRAFGGEVKLVLAGGLDPNLARTTDPDVIYTDFVSDAEKSAIIRHAEVMVNPSHLESLSLLALEAMNNRIPLLVNGKCEVLKDHCKFSGAALWYDNSADFRRKLHRLLTDKTLRSNMAQRGPRYVAENYSWEVIIPKLRAIIENL